ncbi:unnamed protein product, partial [Closterium sp. Naga37s-1]
TYGACSGTTSWQRCHGIWCSRACISPPAPLLSPSPPSACCDCCASSASGTCCGTWQWTCGTTTSPPVCTSSPSSSSSPPTGPPVSSSSSRACATSAKTRGWGTVSPTCLCALHSTPMSPPSTGYGDLSAFTVPERIWAALFMLVNLGLTAYVLGNMTVLLTKADAHTATYRDRLSAINRSRGERVERSRSAGAPQAAPGHCREASGMVWTPISLPSFPVRDDVLLHCPSSVRTLVKRHVYSRFINSSYLFAGTSNVFRDQVITRANVDFFLPHVDLVAAGNSTTELLIIASGQAQERASWCTHWCGVVRHSKVLVRDKDGNEMQWFVLHEGGCVGEIAFLCDLTELWTVRTLSVCRVLSISRDDYRSVARTHPADDRHVITNLLNRVRSRAEATARFYPGNSTMAELSLLLKNEVEPVHISSVGAARDFSNESISFCCSSPSTPHLPLPHISTFRLPTSLPHFHLLRLPASLTHHSSVSTLAHPVVPPPSGAGDADGRALPPKGVHSRVEPQLFPSTPLLPTPQSFRNRLVQETLMNLCYAAKLGDMLECFRLAAGGFDVAAADYDGRTPMHLAAVTGQDKVVQFLLAHGAQVNAKDAFWRTPLQEAVAAGHWSTAEILRSVPSLPLTCWHSTSLSLLLHSPTSPLPIFHYSPSLSNAALPLSPLRPPHPSHISSQPPGNDPAAQSPEAHVPSRLLHHHPNHPARLSLPLPSPLPVVQSPSPSFTMQTDKRPCAHPSLAA